MDVDATYRVDTNSPKFSLDEEAQLRRAQRNVSIQAFLALLPEKPQPPVCTKGKPLTAAHFKAMEDYLPEITAWQEQYENLINFLGLEHLRDHEAGKPTPWNPASSLPNIPTNMAAKQPFSVTNLQDNKAKFGGCPVVTGQPILG